MNCGLKTKTVFFFGYLVSWVFFSLSLAITVFFLAYGLLTGGGKRAWDKYIEKQMEKDAYEALQTYCSDYYNSVILKNENYFMSFDSGYYDSFYSKANTNFRFRAYGHLDGASTLSVAPGFFYNSEEAYVSKTYNWHLMLSREREAVKEAYFTNDYDAEEYMHGMEEQGYICEYMYSDNRIKVTALRNVKEDNSIVVEAYIPKELTAKDGYYWTREFFMSYSSDYGTAAVVVLCLSVPVLLFMISGLVKRSVGRSGDENVRLRLVDGIPLDFFAFLLIGTVVLTFCIIRNIFLKKVNSDFDVTEFLIYGIFAAVLIGALFIEFILSAAVRIKSGVLLKNMLVSRLAGMLTLNLKRFKEFVKNIGAYKKTAFIFFGIDIILFGEFLFLLTGQANHGYESRKSALVMAVILYTVVFFALILIQCYVIYSIYLVQKSCEKIAEGDLDYSIDNKYLLKYFGGISDSINSIGDGMNKALQESMKSEKFKAELITNVSHDIKTPLTSIISYVDILRNNRVSGEETEECMEVIERQAVRLKKLLEDLVEISKASTGNLQVEYSELDIAIFLEQAIGEYEERLAEKGLKAVYENKTEECKVYTDGRYLWRVIDNLFNNICKYSLENTRVFITLEKNSENRCVISFKNISKYELDLSPDEITERFVRGDKSRNSEGSGLGLAIAKNLTEAMNGRFFIELEGDLFKAVVSVKL